MFRSALLALLFLTVKFSINGETTSRRTPIISDSAANKTIPYRIEHIKLECNNFTKTIRIGVCKIVAKRGTGGLVNLVLYYKGVTDLKHNFKMLYRGTSGRYQPFLVDVTYDRCQIHRDFSNNPIFIRVIKFLDQFGPFNVSLYDVNKLTAALFPPVVPEGTFLCYHRLLNSKNETLGEIKSFIRIRGNGLHDMIKLG